MITPAQTERSVVPLRFGRPLNESEFLEIQNRLALDHCKWDIQIGDTTTLFRQPLLIDFTNWRELARMAEALAGELMAAEHEIANRPELYSLLGLPPALHRSLREASDNSAPVLTVRTLRFDFHYTTQGWRISEVNSDVPGGYCEASRFTQFVSRFTPHSRPAGDPAKDWTDAMIRLVGSDGRVALLSAPGFLEDQQVTAFLAGELQARGLQTFFLHEPSQIYWISGRAHVSNKRESTPVDAIVRFYQGEWLWKLPDASNWKRLLAFTDTPVTNPGIALLTESKRFPLIWDRIQNKMVQWRSLLPESCDPRDGRWQCNNDGSWVLKEVFCNTGDSVHMRETADPRSWAALKRAALKHPDRWVVQRKFETCPVPSSSGSVYPCIGVYTINGQVAGAYTRASLQPVIDYNAMDVALLVSEEESHE
jgi:glutathionylspermidine synthase